MRVFVPEPNQTGSVLYAHIYYCNHDDNSGLFLEMLPWVGQTTSTVVQDGGLAFYCSVHPPGDGA